jgi:hypothetical protein
MKTPSRILSIMGLLIEEDSTNFTGLTASRILAAAENPLRQEKQDLRIKLTSMQINHLKRLPFALINLAINIDILAQHFIIHPLNINLCSDSSRNLTVKIQVHLIERNGLKKSIGIHLSFIGTLTKLEISVGKKL